MARPPRSDQTVFMSVPQFCADQLNITQAEFEHVCEWQTAVDVWWSFRQALDRGTVDKNMKDDRKIDTEYLEHHYTDAWRKVDDRHHLCDGFFLHLSRNRLAERTAWSPKIDGSFIANEDRHQVIPDNANWALQQLAMEFRYSKSPVLDPFGPSANEDAAKQLQKHVANVFAFQHRTAMFMLSVTGDWFRVIRWDHSGAIVSEAIDYVSTVLGTQVLLTVLRGFSMLSREQRGHDLTAVRLSKNSCGWKRMDALALPCQDDLDYHERVIDISTVHPEFLKMLDPRKRSDSPETLQSAASFSDPCSNCTGEPTCSCKSAIIIPVFRHIRKIFRRTLVNGFPRYRLRVCGMNYLVGREVHLQSEVVGRGTRGFIALQWGTERFVFLKDCWRIADRSMDHEGAVLLMLNMNDVPNVPTLIANADLPCGEERGKAVLKLQETETFKYSQRSGLKQVKTAPDVLDAMAQQDENEDDRYEEQQEPEAQTIIAGFPVVPKPEFYTGGFRSACHWSCDGSKRFHSEPYVKPSPTANDERKPNMRGVKRTFAQMVQELPNLRGRNLRGYVHTRVIVEDICMPLSLMTSSKQMVQIMHDAIVAHEGAYKKCEYLHGDVSFGNIMMRPVLRRLEGGTHDVHWEGVLVDWEFGQRISQGEREPVFDRQGTGTWEFMSQALLDDSQQSNTVPDELEAFVHSMVYGAFCFLKSNINAISGFMDFYFSDRPANISGGPPNCPGFKRQSLYCSRLEAGSNKITFHARDQSGNLQYHPINDLFCILLERCHCRYAVLGWAKEWEQARKETQEKVRAKDQLKRTNASTSATLLTRPSRRPFFPTRMSRDDHRHKDTDMDVDRYYSQPPRFPPLSKSTVHMKESIETHEFFIQFLRECIRSMDWPSELDIVPNRRGGKEAFTNSQAKYFDSQNPPVYAPQVPRPDAAPNNSDRGAPPEAYPENPRSAAHEAPQSVVADGPPPAKRQKRERNTKGKERMAATDAIEPAYSGRVTRSRAAAAAGPSHDSSDPRTTRFSSRLRAKRAEQTNASASGSRMGTESRTTRAQKTNASSGTVVATASRGRGRDRGRGRGRGRGRSARQG